MLVDQLPESVREAEGCVATHFDPEIWRVDWQLEKDTWTVRFANISVKDQVTRYRHSSELTFGYRYDGELVRVGSKDSSDRLLGFLLRVGRDYERILHPTPHLFLYDLLYR